MGIVALLSYVQINRIREQSDIPLSVFEKRKRLMGIVFAVDSQGKLRALNSETKVDTCKMPEHQNI